MGRHVVGGNMALRIARRISPVSASNCRTPIVSEDAPMAALAMTLPLLSSRPLIFVMRPNRPRLVRKSLRIRVPSVWKATHQAFYGNAVCVNASGGMRCGGRMEMGVAGACRLGALCEQSYVGLRCDRSAEFAVVHRESGR